MLWESITGSFIITTQSHQVFFCVSVSFLPIISSIYVFSCFIFLALIFLFFTYIYSYIHIYIQLLILLIFTLNLPIFLFIYFSYYQSVWPNSYLNFVFYYGSADKQIFFFIWKKNRRSRPLEKKYECFSNFPFFSSLLQ